MKKLCDLRILREIYKSSHGHYFSHAKNAESAKIPVLLRWRWSVAASREESAEVSRKLVLIHPLPLRVLTPVSGGEFAGAVFAVVTNCPPETGGRRGSLEE